MSEQLKSLVADVEAAVTEAMERALPAELAGADPLVRHSDHADFQSNVALSLAKKAGRPPRELATQLAAHLSELPWLESVELAGPGFLNITVSDRKILETMRGQAAGADLGVRATHTDEVVVLDYSGPNIAKEMHVGHLRSTLIGDVLARVLGRLGADVVRQNHVGDWGTQFGMLIQYIDEHSAHSWREGGETVGSELDTLYKAARAEFDADPGFKERAQQRVVLLQSGDEESVRIWREIVEVSEKSFQTIYDRLGVLLTPEDILGESFYNPMLDDVVRELTDKGIIEESDGALCVFFDDIRSPDDEPVPLLVRKRDGGYGYGATDLATIRYSIDERKATSLLYVVDARQSQHFDMIFRTSRRAGWLTDQTAVHVQHGTVNGPDGRPFKTRSGGVFRLSDLLDSAEERAAAIVAEKAVERGESPDAAAVEALSKIAGIGAVKYAELATSRTKDYSFDVDRMVSFNGQTGVYLQYTHTRIKSILRQAPAGVTGAIDVELPLGPAERALALEIDDFDSVLQLVATTLEPHRLAGYLFSLAKAYTDFYEACPVLRAPSDEVRAHRLGLCELTARVLAQGLDLLGIAAPERM